MFEALKCVHGAPPAGARAMPRCGTEPLKVSAHSGYARCADAGSPGGCATLPEKAQLRSAWQSNTAALRLRASLDVCRPQVGKGRSPRGFFQALGVFSLPRFSLAVAIPPEVCASPAQPARGVHKRCRASRLAHLLQTLRAHSGHARHPRLAGDSEGKTGRKKDLPRPEKNRT